MRRPLPGCFASLGPAAFAVAVAFCQLAAADVFELDHGGQVEGEWLNRQEQPLTRYVVRTAAGITLTLPADQVRQAIRQSPAELEYARRAAAAADTVEAQWALAQWCATSGLPRQRTRHLERVVALDPDHRLARALLGFQFVSGQWVRRADLQRQQGYELYRGRWRTAQEIEILETRAKKQRAEKEWLAKLRRWRQDLGTDKAAAASSSLAAVRDPVAVKPLADCFARERTRPVKMLYADVLEAIGTADALAVLIDRALADADEEIFHYCLDKVVRARPPRAVDAFVAALKDTRNVKVNRAAVALARLEDKSAIPPLIEALITTHSQVLPGVGPDATTAVFSDSGPFIKKSDGPKVLIFHVQNHPVLDALVRLAGVNFAFDQQAWRYWYAQDQIAREAAATLAAARSP